jgi:hypothetical protein
MGKSERVGLGLCVAVLAIYLMPVAGLIVYLYLHTSRDFGVLTLLVGAMVALLSIVLPSIVLPFWKGQPAARWISCVLLVLVGVMLIADGYWMTTLEFPNAVNAEERVRMQEDCRRELPWWIASGALYLLAGALLLLPPVGRFLHTRREAWAQKAAERQISDSVS